jgi:hypothetical protein
MDIRVRMVLLGLVLGVIVAVIVAAEGCGQHHPRKQRPATASALSARYAGAWRRERSTRSRMAQRLPHSASTSQ